MMDSKASHKTIKKIATPAAKAPGAGIMCGIVLVWRRREKAAAPSGVETCGDADLCLEKFGNRAARFGGLDGGVEFRFIRAGNSGHEVEMALGDGESFADFVERDGRSGLQFLRGHAGAAELRGKGHRETSRMRRGEELFRISAHAVFKARAEGILGLFQDPAVGRDRALAVFQAALPDCRCFALHEAAPFALFAEFVRLESREFDSSAIEKGILTGRSCRVR